MPELPEVETIVRGMRKRIVGKTVILADVLHPKPLGALTAREFNAFIRNRVISGVERFGKYIHILFDDTSSLVCHLRMTGKFIFCAEPPAEPETQKHIRIVFHFSDKSCLLFKDLRIFGTIRVYAPGVSIREKAAQGLEPLAPHLTPEYLLDKAKHRQVAVKIFLLDQKVITGLGNIYACEILFRARINPFLPAARISRQQADRLLAATRDVITQAIKCNGTSISDFRNVDDKQGRFQELLMVYQRTGAVCRVCGKGSIMRVKQGQRSTFYCPVCQEEKAVPGIKGRQA